MRSHHTFKPTSVSTLKAPSIDPFDLSLKIQENNQIKHPQNSTNQSGPKFAEIVEAQVKSDASSALFPQPQNPCLYHSLHSDMSLVRRDCSILEILLSKAIFWKIIAKRAPCKLDLYVAGWAAAATAGIHTVFACPATTNACHQQDSITRILVAGPNPEILASLAALWTRQHGSWAIPPTPLF